MAGLVYAAEQHGLTPAATARAVPARSGGGRGFESRVRSRRVIRTSGPPSLKLRRAPLSAKAVQSGRPLRLMAGWTGLEPATFCVTGRRSNQLSYHPVNRERRRNVGSRRCESSVVFPLSVFLPNTTRAGTFSRW